MKTVKFLTGLLAACLYLIALPIVAVIAVLANFPVIIALDGNVVFDIKCREKESDL